MADEIRSKFNHFQFTPPGPVAAAYIVSKGPIDLIMGPWGSGKTVGTVFKIARHSAVDAPICKDGVIHVRTAAIRDTYREMAKTALSSWHEFFPKKGPFTAQEKDAYAGGQDRPVKHVLEWDVVRQWYRARGVWEPRMTKVRLEMEFGAIGEQNLDSFFKGYEITFGWMNECDLLNEDVPGRFYGRTGRYPPASEIMEWEGERLGLVKDPDSGDESINVPRIVMGDYNPPDEANWTYKRHIEEPENWPGYNFFQQPSGLSPRAENRLGKARYKYEEEERQFGGPDSAEARRNVHGEYAAKRQGTVVYPGFQIMKHRAEEVLKPNPALPFYMGFDGGGRPACGIGQFQPNGQFRGLREVTCPTDEVTGPERFAAMVVDTLLRDFRGVPFGGAWGDPSDFQGADQVAGQLALMQIIGQALGISIYPTESNDIAMRTQAMAFYLKDIDAHTPGSLWCPSCKMTVRGFVSQYHLTKHATEGKTDRLEIAKNFHSHIMNAWEYLLYGFRGRAALQHEASRLGRPKNVVSIQSKRARTDFNIWDT